MAKYSPWDLNKLGRALQGEVSLRALLGLQGKLNPWEQPEWQGLTEGIRTKGDMATEGLSKQLAAADVTGPAAATALERSKESTDDQILNLASGMKSGLTEQGWQGAKMGKDQNQFMLDYTLQKEKQADAMKAEKMSQISGNIMSGIGMASKGISGGIEGAKGGGGCCFHFIYGEGELTDTVRLARDYYVSHFKNGEKVAKGYVRMANRILPILNRMKHGRALLHYLMTGPMTRFAEWFRFRRGGGVVFFPVALFWIVVWDILGSR